MNEDIKIPKYQIIENDIIDQIHQGILKDEQSIPSENSLMAKYNCSRVTVRQALGNLQYKGFIYKKQGSGSYVKNAPALHKHPAMKSFSEDMIELGKKPSSQVTTFNITMAGENVAALLKIKKEDKVYYIERIRYADDIPMMFERSFLSVSMHPDLSFRIMEGSKYKYADDHGFAIDYSHQRVSPVFPSEYIADSLKISPKQPVLRINNTVYLKNGDVFEYTELFMNPDHYQLDLIKKR